MLSSEPTRWRATLSLWFVLFLIWTAVNGTLEPTVSGLGLVVTLGIAVFWARSSEIWRDISFSPWRVLLFLQYSAVFLREMVKSNFIVVGYVFSPRLRIRPGIVLARTGLKSAFGRLVLSNSVALTPGSLVIGMDGPDVYVHGLDLATTDTDANSRAFLGPFEPILSRTFG